MINEETLSDHRYICFKFDIGTTRGKEKVKKGFDFVNTDWGFLNLISGTSKGEGGSPQRRRSRNSKPLLRIIAEQGLKRKD